MTELSPEKKGSVGAFGLSLVFVGFLTILVGYSPIPKYMSSLYVGLNVPFAMGFIVVGTVMFFVGGCIMLRVGFP